MIEWEIRTVKTGQCRKYSDVPKQAKILSVNGKEVFGNCESCGKLILQEEFWSDSEGIELCKNCEPSVGIRL